MRRPKKRSAWNLKEKIDFCLKHIQSLYGQVKMNMTAIEEITKILDEEGLHGKDPEETDENPEGPGDGGHPEGGDRPDGNAGADAEESSPPES